MGQFRSETPSAGRTAAALFLDACLLIRDIFLYAIPGGLLFAIGLASHRLNLDQVNGLLAPYHPPTWALALLLTAACYLAGRLLFVIVSLRVEFWKLVHWADADWLADYPNEITSRDLVLRHYFPGLFRDLERRETATRFAFSCFAALLIGWLIFVEFQPRFADVIIGTAILIFLATLTWISHLGRIRKAIHAAGKEIEDREKAAREVETVIQPTGDELRFVIDSIFKAAELTSRAQASDHEGLKPQSDAQRRAESSQAEPEATAQEPLESAKQTASAQAASASQGPGRSFGTPRL